MTRRRIPRLAAGALVLATITTLATGPAGPAGAQEVPPAPRAEGPPEGAVIFFPQGDGLTVSYWAGQRDERLVPWRDHDLDVRQALVGNFDGDGFDEVYGYTRGSSEQIHARPFFAETPEGPQYALSLIGSHLSGAYIPLVGDFGGPTTADGRPIDDILWYAPGPTGDTLWIHKPNGEASRYHPRIDGTYRPVVLEGDGTGPEAIVWHAPGPAPDSIWDFRDAPTGAYRTYPLRIDGDYQPTSFATDGARLVHWYSATGHDSTWRFDGIVGGAARFAGLPTPQVSGPRRAIALDRGATAGVFLHAPGAEPDTYVGTTDAAATAMAATSTQVWGSFRYVVAGDVTSATPGQRDGVDELIFARGTRAVMWRMPTIGTRVETAYEGLAPGALPAVVATELPPG